MISFDTNIAFAAINADAAQHAAAKDFVETLAHQTDVVISEIVLLELFVLLRNPVVLEKPLSARDASSVCAAFRQNLRWQCVALPPETRRFHDVLWSKLASNDFARRRSYDIRLALSLIDQGVTEFATVNLKDFANLGFKRVWNPLAAARA